MHAYGQCILSIAPFACALLRLRCCFSCNESHPVCTFLSPCVLHRCEVFQLHPELEATEKELIQHVTRLRTETNALLPQLPGASGDLLVQVRKKLQRICDTCAQLDASFRLKVSTVCPDSCKRGHRHPPQGASACLLAHLAQPLIMQSFILVRMHLADSDAASPAALKRRGEWRRRQALLCQDAAALLAHIIGLGSSTCTLMSLEPLLLEGEGGSDKGQVDSATKAQFEQQRVEIAQRYERFHGVPLPRVGTTLLPSAKTAVAKGKRTANGHDAPASSPHYTLPAFMRDDAAAAATRSSASSAATPAPSISASTSAATAVHPSVAEAAAHLQRAFTLLHEPLRRYLLLQPSGESAATRLKEVQKLDVANCLKKLYDHPDAALAKVAKDAVQLRNVVSHQSLQTAAGRKGLQLLHQLAEMLSADEEATQIALLIPTIHSASKMQQLAQEALSAAAQSTKIGQFTESTIELTRVIDMPQLSTLSVEERAVLYLARTRANITLERWRPARDDAEQATHLCPTDPEGSVLLVEALQQLKLIAEAEGECRRALNLSPHHPKLLLLQRQCVARLCTQHTDWHSSKLPPTEATLDNLRDTMQRTNAEHATRTPVPSDVRTIRLAEMMADRKRERANSPISSSPTSCVTVPVASWSISWPPRRRMPRLPNSAVLRDST